jgi:hypothetical protein
LQAVRRGSRDDSFKFAKFNGDRSLADDRAVLTLSLFANRHANSHNALRCV